jgi:opacity protein-like surface antigen
MNKVQKLLLALAATSTVLSSSAFAEDSSFYLTAGGGLFMGSKLASNYKLTVEPKNEVKYKKPALGGEILAGVGYYAMDNLRVEAVFVKPFFGKSKNTIVNGIAEIKEKAAIQEVGNVGDLNYVKAEEAVAAVPAKDKVTNITPTVNSLQVRAYYDAFEFADMGKAYVGAGFGWANIKSKSVNNAGDVVSSKAKNTLAWTVGVGASFDVADGVKLAAEYNYQDFGKYKAKEGPKLSLKGHALLAKVMFSI